MFGKCSLLVSSVLGGMSGSLAEALPFPLDDNLSLPVVSGVMFLALRRWLVGDCEVVGERVAAAARVADAMHGS